MTVRGEEPGQNSQTCRELLSRSLALAWLRLPELAGKALLGGCRTGPGVWIEGGKLWMSPDATHKRLKALYPAVARALLRESLKPVVSALRASGFDSLHLDIALTLKVEATLYYRGVPAYVNRLLLTLAGISLGMAPSSIASSPMEELAARVDQALSKGGLRAYLLLAVLPRIRKRGAKGLSNVLGKVGTQDLPPSREGRSGVGRGRGFASAGVPTRTYDVSWVALLYIASLPGAFPSYRRLAKKLLVTGYKALFPSRYGRPPARLYALVDASGSMNGTKLEAALSYAVSAAITARLDGSVILFDDGVRAEYRAEELERSKNYIQGFGGTRVELAVEHVARKSRQGDAVLVISDWESTNDDLSRTARLLAVIAAKGVNVVLASVGERRPPRGPWKTVMLPVYRGRV